MALLLDTCVAIWLANGEPMSADSRAAIRSASRTGDVLVSPVSAKLLRYGRRGHLRVVAC